MVGLALLSSMAYAKDIPLTQTAPLWRVDLRPAGYAEPQSPDRDYLFREGLVFTDNQTIVVSVLAGPWGRSADGHLVESASGLQLQAFVIHAETGRVRATTQWRMASHDTRLIPTHDGRFLLQSGEHLALISPDLEKLREADFHWFWLGKYGDHEPLLSPSGRIIFLQKSYVDGYDILLSHDRSDRTVVTGVQRSARYAQDILMIDADSLDVTRTIRSMRRMSSASEHLIATRAVPEPFKWKEGCICVRGTDTEKWRAIYRNKKNPPGDPMFSSETVLVIPTRRGVLAMTTSGEVLLDDQKFARGLEAEGELHRTATGERFGLVMGRMKQVLFDTFLYVAHSYFLVYDIATRGCVYCLDLQKPVRRKDQWIASIPALSPDGRCVARLRDGIVELFRVPETQ
jgi:hypothetical protein